MRLPSDIGAEAFQHHRRRSRYELDAELNSKYRLKPEFLVRCHRVHQNHMASAADAAQTLRVFDNRNAPAPLVALGALAIPFKDRHTGAMRIGAVSQAVHDDLPFPNRDLVTLSSWSTSSKATPMSANRSTCRVRDSILSASTSHCKKMAAAGYLQAMRSARAVCKLQRDHGITPPPRRNVAPVSIGRHLELAESIRPGPKAY